MLASSPRVYLNGMVYKQMDIRPRSLNVEHEDMYVYIYAPLCLLFYHLGPTKRTFLLTLIQDDFVEAYTAVAQHM
jgi:hypothetical protein